MLFAFCSFRDMEVGLGGWRGSRKASEAQTPATPRTVGLYCKTCSVEEGVYHCVCVCVRLMKLLLTKFGSRWVDMSRWPCVTGQVGDGAQLMPPHMTPFGYVFWGDV